MKRKLDFRCIFNDEILLHNRGFSLSFLCTYFKKMRYFWRVFLYHVGKYSNFYFLEYTILHTYINLINHFSYIGNEIPFSWKIGKGNTEHVKKGLSLLMWFLMTCYIINREIHIIIIICFSLFFADEQLGDGLESNLDYSCTLTPLFSIELLSNQSYILQLNFSPPRKNISLADDSIFSTMSSKPALIKEISLTVIVEDDNFHAALFYLKCLCVPFVLGKNNINFLIFFIF